MPGVQVGIAYVDVKPDLSGFSRELRAGVGRDMAVVGDQAGKKFGSSISSSIKGAVAGFGAAFAGSKFTGFISGAIQASSDLNEAINKSSVVFGQSSLEVEGWARGAADSFGLSTQAALEAAGTFGNMFDAMGLGVESSQAMSTKIVELASDLASFNNIPIPDVLERLRSGLLGEQEAVERLGINMSETRLKAVAMGMGFGNGKSLLDANAKAMAAYSIIMEDTGNAQGDFARTSDQLANQQRTTTAQWANAKAELGENLVPIMKGFVGFLNAELIPAFRTLFTQGGEATGWAATLTNIIGDVLGFLVGTAQQTLRFFANMMTKLPFGWGDDMAADFRAAADSADEFRYKLHRSKEELLEQANATRNADLATKLLTLSTKDAAGAVADQSKAIRDSSKATREAAASERALRQARADLADLLAEGAVNDKDVADARKSLAEATRGAAAADRDLADAQEEYEKAKGAADILGTDTALEAAEDAADSLADAVDSSASAHEKATEATLALAKAQAGDPEFQDKLADARDKVADAEDKVATAELATVAATPAMLKAIGDRTEAVKLLNEQWKVTADHLGLLNDSGNILTGMTSGAAPLGPGAGPLGPNQNPIPIVAPAPPPAFNLPAFGVPAPTNNITVNVAAPVQDPALIGKAISWIL